MADTGYPNQTDFNNETRVPLVMGLTNMIFGLALIVVVLRMYCRTFVSSFRGPDDWWMLAATVFALSDQSLKIAWLQNGLGRHVSALTPAELQILFKLTFTTQVLYPIGLGLVKVSILTFYLRLFPYQRFRKLCYVVLALVCCMTLSISLAMLFACKPIDMGWQLLPQGGDYCVNKAAIQYAGSSMNLGTDLLILILPIKYLWALSLDKKKRFGIIALFSMGCCTCVASAIRISTIKAIYSTIDGSWTGSNIAICSAMEINITIIAASIPAIKPLFSKYLPTRFFGGEETKVSKASNNFSGMSGESTVSRWDGKTADPESQRERQPNMASFKAENIAAIG